MPQTHGITQQQAGKVSREGYIAPPIGQMAHALYFNTAPSVTDKAQEIIAKGRLTLPGVVVVNNETIGRRKGSKAVPKGWWADHGSLTAAFAFSPRPDITDHQWLQRTAAAVLRVIASFQPRLPASFRPQNDLLLDGRRLGAVFVRRLPLADLAIVRLNCSTDFTGAPAAISTTACRLIDYISLQQLPMQNPGVLSNVLGIRLMTEMPREFTPATGTTPHHRT